MTRGLTHVAPLDWGQPALEDRVVPPGCAVADLIHEGRHLAYVIQKSEKGGDEVHITPEGHKVLGRRLRALARSNPQPAARHE